MRLFQQSGEMRLLQQSGEERLFQESGEERLFQWSGEERLLQQSGVVKFLQGLMLWIENVQHSISYGKKETKHRILMLQYLNTQIGCN